ncbi:MAG: arylsulfatase [Lentisphaerae bacterium]|nr:arylsulfatase [Lentisphaerota bacterium]
MSDRPNIIYIMADDMGYGDLGCYGATKIPTPNIDKLAAEGMCLLDAHSSSAVCTPSRYSVLTGRYCWRTHHKTGVTGGFDLPLIDPARLTTASMLKQHGYATAAVGKWHLGFEWQAKDGETIDYTKWDDGGNVDYSKPIIGGPVQLGFDYFFGISGSLDMAPYCFIENDRTVGIPSEEKDPYNPQQKKGFMTPGWRDEDCDLQHAQKAVEFIERHHEADNEQPFFLYLTPAAPHRPCMPHERFKGSSEAGPRGDMVVVVDFMVGEIVETLDRLGIADNTMVVVTSDNGAQPFDVDRELHDHKSCGDLRGYKSHIWDGGHREPFVVRWPAMVAAGSTCKRTIGLTDMMATCAEIAGADLPHNAAEDSISFLSALEGDEEGSGTGHPIVHHALDGMFSIRDGKWKLVLGRNHGGFAYDELTGVQEDDLPGQLYDMETDVPEATNLYGEHPEIVERLSALLQQYKESGRSRPRSRAE